MFLRMHFLIKEMLFSETLKSYRLLFIYLIHI